MTESIELKPCPFCGGVARLQHDTSSDHWQQWKFLVICTNIDECWISGKEFDTPEEAIAFWNTRHEPEAAPFAKAYEFKALNSGDYDSGFAFAVPVEDFEAIEGEWDEWNLNKHHKGLLNLFPQSLLPEAERRPDPQAYHYKITVEATPIDAMPPIPERVMEVVKKAYKFRLGEDLDEMDEPEQAPQYNLVEPTIKTAIANASTGRLEI